MSLVGLTFEASNGVLECPHKRMRSIGRYLALL